MRGPRGLKAVGRMWSPKRWHPAFLPASPRRLNSRCKLLHQLRVCDLRTLYRNAVEQIQLGKQDIVFAGGGESCAGKWLVNSTRWVRCLPNQRHPGKSLPYL